MQSTGARIAIAIAGVAVVVVLFLVLSDDGGDDESTTGATMPAQSQERPAETPKPKPEETVTEIQVRGGQPVGGVAEIEAQNGEEVRLVVSSPDTTEHVHVHGYDLFADLAPGKPAKLSFDATIDGVFEIELEESATHLAELTVEP
jgi:hypothetical protein